MSHLLDVRDLTIEFRTQDGIVHALNHVSLTLNEGESLGLVGETGAGKTTLAKGIMRLTACPPGYVTAGSVAYRGRNLFDMNAEEIRESRGRDISMIFQDPMTSLNPVMKVGEQIAEAVSSHDSSVTREQAMRAARDMLQTVGIPPERADEYPHQFSGGMKQRVVIAIALVCNPKILIADEPTTALDVTIQAQVLEMMGDLRRKLKTAMMLITHDLGVVAQNCDRVAIIYAGEIVEIGTVHEVFKKMRHPYTIGLFQSIPSMTEDVSRLKPIDGLMPDPTCLPKGCSFSTRCPYATEKCFEEHPDMQALDGSHCVRCFRAQEEVTRHAE